MNFDTHRRSIHRPAMLLALCLCVATAHASERPCCPNLERATVVTVADATPIETPSVSRPLTGNLSGTLAIAGLDTRIAMPRTFWPWWLGALVLGTLTVTFWLVLRMPFGISSSWDKVINWRRERENEQVSLQVANSHPDKLRDALLAETRAQFGDSALAQPAAAPNAGERRRTENRSAPVSSHLLLLIMVGAGGMLSAFLNGELRISFDLGAAHRAFFGDGMAMWLVLFCGGAIAGFGVRMAGGCNSGHGLSGMSTLEIGSMVTTAAFFGTAIVVSLLIGWVL